ncbi:ABC transporter ATP-binding protein [Methylocella sp.]|uniref:ABC transporter ATP-binding protein n=1 Tax=Methylocella sp. TaxID=1978226 RepID=UPI0035B0A3FC
MSEPAITVEGLGFFYSPGRWLLRNLDATAPRGGVLAVLGPNGRGKTTLLKLLLGALKPCEGAARLDGRTAFVPQLFHASFDYSALDMVLMGRARRIGLFSQPSAQDEAAALDALDRFGVAAHARSPFHSLSGGERQLVIFARALAAQADILILDEPTSALDLKNQALVLRWILRLSREHGLTIVMTTHHPEHALAVADQTLLMTGVSDYALGPSRQVLSEAALERLYEAPVKRVVFEHRGETIETIVPILPPPPNGPERLRYRRRRGRLKTKAPQTLRPRRHEYNYPHASRGPAGRRPLYPDFQSRT